MIRTGFGIFYSQIFSDLGAQVLFPGYTITQSFGSLGTGIPQPFTLSQGMPLVAVQNLQQSAIDALAVRAQQSDFRQRVFRAGRSAAVRGGMELRRAARAAARPDPGGQLCGIERRAPAAQPAL